MFAQCTVWMIQSQQTVTLLILFLRKGPTMSLFRKLIHTTPIFYGTSLIIHLNFLLMSPPIAFNISA